MPGQEDAVPRCAASPSGRADQTRAPSPSALAPPTTLPYEFDLVDPRIARDTNGDGLFDGGQAYANLITYPNGTTLTSLANEALRFGLPPFGGDYTGIIPCLSPDVQPSSAAQQQIATGGTAGCWTNVYRGVIAPGVPRGRNIANTGGRGELPLRPAPDRSNLQPPLGAVAQGIDYAPEPGSFYERNVDTVHGCSLNQIPSNLFSAPGGRGTSGSSPCQSVFAKWY